MKKMRFLLPMIAMVFAMASAVGGEFFQDLTQGHQFNATGECSDAQDLVIELTPCKSELQVGAQCRLDIGGTPLAYQTNVDADGVCTKPIYRSQN